MKRFVLAGTLLMVMAAGSAIAAELPPGGTFADDDGSVHEANIEALAAAGITTGCDADRFCPDDPVTRGQMAAFLTRSLGLPPGSDDRFVDDDESIFEADIEALAEANITFGCRADAFCPDAVLTRAEAASFLVRAFHHPLDERDWFDDDDGSVHEPNIDALAAAGITVGCDERAFCPLDPVTRAQAATFLVRELGLTPIVPPPPTTTTTTTLPDCLTGAGALPTGTLEVMGGESGVLGGSGPVHEFRVEVETGLGIDGPCFASSVESILGDANGWTRAATRSFRRVDDAGYDVRVILASPATTDDLCVPLDTAGIFSCRVGDRVVLNSWRWEHGATDFGTDLVTYRRYLVNHEIGHWLGKSHRTCPAAGTPAPVMMQQTKTVGACLPNGWPLDDEL